MDEEDYRKNILIIIVLIVVFAWLALFVGAPPEDANELPVWVQQSKDPLVAPEVPKQFQTKP